MNYYKRHLGDYSKDTRWITTYQHGVYALLLDWYYSNEKPVPLDIAYRIVSARSGPERRAVDEVLMAFFDLSKAPGFAHNKRADIDISKYKVKSSNNSLIALEREGTKRARNVVGNEGSSCSSGEPSHKPLATSHKEEQKQSGADAPDPKKIFWDNAVACVGENNRARVGKLCKSYGEEAVAKAIADAVMKRPADPMAYIARIVQKSESNPWDGAL